MRNYVVCTGLAVALLLQISPPVAAQHPVVPAYNSNPGAAYTVYLDFGGFSFNGTWGGTSSPSGTPGVTPAYDSDGNASTFSATELANIQKIWAWTAEKYAPFNVNVTTVDPAPAGNTDSQRQAFYDQTARMMHTVVGGSGSWSGGGGVSFVGTTQNTYGTSANSGAGSGFHTNWVFAAEAPTNIQFVGEASAHENGHGFGLSHQSDVNGSGTTLGDGYSGGNWKTDGTLGGNGTVAPIMGNSYYAQRGTWRNGTVQNGGGALQNDPAVIQANSGMGNFTNTGIGRSLGTATPLPLTSSVINFNLAKGVIVPLNNSSPNPIGVSNYSSDFYSFSTSGGINTINLVAGSERITPGVADGGATLDGSLFILNSVGTVLFSSVTANLSESLSVTLPAGNYFIEVSSAGGETLGSFNNPSAVSTQYYDMGSYFLTGSIVAVPEPATIALFGVVFAAVGYRGWRYRQQQKKAMNQRI